MIIKLFDKKINDDRFYLMITDTLDDFISKDDPEFIEEIVEEFIQKLKEDIERIIEEAAYDWVADNI